MSKAVDTNSDATFFVRMVMFSFVMSVGIAGSISLYYGFQNLNAPIDASIVNGILTATAIVFAFVTFEAREIEPERLRFFLTGLLVGFLFWTGGIYFFQVMDPNIGHPTKLVLAVAMANFHFNILSSVSATHGKRLLRDEAERGI
jgi:hypothetical protein